MCPRRLAWPRTSPFHGGNTGSNPVGDATLVNSFPVILKHNFLSKTKFALRWCGVPGDFYYFREPFGSHIAKFLGEISRGSYFNCGDYSYILRNYADYNLVFCGEYAVQSPYDCGDYLKYIHQLKKWPDFYWNQEKVAEQLTLVRHHQGILLGRMQGLGFGLREEAVLKTLTEEVIKSSEIEGEKLDRTQVRSSLARRLGIDVGGLGHVDRHVEGVVEMMLDATQKFAATLTSERLFGWHASLFPTGRSGMTKIPVGRWRDGQDGPMQVVSGPIGKNKVHFEAPKANILTAEIKTFLTWFNGKKPMDPVLRSALAHLWFVTIHPFDDGNGRIARAIADMALARSENSPQRFYSMSAQISLERKAYYDVLESTQKGNLDITNWFEWFLSCLNRAFTGAEIILATVLKKTRFWEIHDTEKFSDRQRKVITRLLDGFEGKLTSSKWAKLAKCSQDTASRDIDDLIGRKILIRNPGGGRSTSYSLNEK